MNENLNKGVSIPLDLEKAITNNNLIVFIGAGLSYDLLNINGDKIRGWNYFVKSFLKYLEITGYDVSYLYPLLDRHEPIKVLELIDENRNISKSEIYSFSKEFFDLSNEKNCFRIHKKIYNLSHQIISTNYDNAFELAIPTLRKNKAYRGKNFELLKHKELDTPFIYKLHGCFEDAKSMIIFPDNYDSLYSSFDLDAEHAIFVLENLIYNKTILFIGTGLGDYQVNSLFKRIKYIQQKFNQKHYIITKEKLDSSLDFIEPIYIDDFNEIEELVDKLILVKKNNKAKDSYEIAQLKKELHEAQKKIVKLSSLVNPNTKMKLEREAYEHYSRGIQFSLLNKFKKALFELNRAIDLKIDFPEAYYTLGTCYGNLAISGRDDKIDLYAEKSFESYSKGIKLKNNFKEAYYGWGTFLASLAQKKNSNESKQLYLNSLIKLENAIKIDPKYHEAIYNYANVLGYIANISTDSESKLLYTKSIIKYQEALKINPNKWEAYFAWGTNLNNLANLEREVENKANYLKDSLQKIYAAIKINPNYSSAYINLGNSLSDLAELNLDDNSGDLINDSIKHYRKAVELDPKSWEIRYIVGLKFLNITNISEKESLIEEMFEKSIENFNAAIEIEPDNSKGYFSLGNCYLQKGMNAPYTEKEKPYLLAFRCYKSSVNLDPDFYPCYFNWAKGLIELSEVKNNIESNELLLESIKKLRKTTQLMKDFYLGYYYWGIGLFSLSQIYSGTRKKEALLEAIDKFEIVLKINPDFYDSYYQLGIVYDSYFRLLKEPKSEKYLNKAIENYQKAVDFGLNAYNLACLFAKNGNNEYAFKYLEVCLSKGDVNSEVVMQDEDWDKLMNNLYFKKLIKKYSDKAKDII